ncbi:hypothetical protein BDZ91DRAFT_722100, partial [Kalaharituber pfeilii]
MCSTSQIQAFLGQHAMLLQRGVILVWYTISMLVFCKSIRWYHSAGEVLCMSAV